jgi:putative hydrolase of the HAD superfamily
VTARFDALLFDAGGVLVVPDPVGIGSVLAPFVAFSVAQGIRAHYAGMRALETSLLSADDAGTLEEKSWREYRRGYCRAVGVAEAELEEAVRIMATVFTPPVWRHRVEEAVAALWRLNKKQVPMGVVSNASGQIEAVLRNEGVCQVGAGAGVPVHCVVDSHVVGVAKPHPGIFAPALAALAALGIDRSRVAYVGDSVVNDVGGAERAGIHPLHLDPFDDHPDAGHERIRSLGELLDWV